MFEDDQIIAQIPHLRRFARALTGERAAADDLVQDTIERALNKRRLFRPRGSLRAWLFTVMRNVYRNQLSRSGHPAKGVALEESRHLMAVPPSQEDRLRTSDMERALARLPSEQKEVVLLVGLEQLSYKDVSTVVGVPVGTVMSRLHRGRERLRALTSADALVDNRSRP